MIGCGDGDLDSLGDLGDGGHGDLDCLGDGGQGDLRDLGDGVHGDREDLGVLGDGVRGELPLPLGEQDGEGLAESVTVGVTDRGLVRVEL